MSMRRIQGTNAVTGPKDIKADKAGSLHVVQALSPGAIITALGHGYQVISTTAAAALIVRPSTTPMVTLFNGESAGGNSYIIERAFAHCLVSCSAVQSRFAIWLCQHPVGSDIDIASTLTPTGNTRGRTGYGGQAHVAITSEVANDGWYPWSVSQDVEDDGILPGAVAIAEVGGRIIVPPQGAISMTVVASLETNTFCVGFHWYEEIVDLAA